MAKKDRNIATEAEKDAAARSPDFASRQRSHGTRLDNGRSRDDPPIKNEHVREGSPAPPASLSGSKSLVAQAAEMRKADQYLDERTRKRLDQEQYEAALLKEANQVQTNALTSVVEIATGEARGDKMKTSWTCPRFLLSSLRKIMRRIERNGVSSLKVMTVLHQ